MPSRTVERLEPRRLLASAALLAGGQLRVTGQNGVDDAVTVGLNAGGNKVNVAVNGVVVKSFAKAGVKNVTFFGRGDDTLNVSERNGAFDIPVRFFGGAGNDSIVTGDDRDVIYASGGDDTISAGRGTKSPRPAARSASPCRGRRC